VNSKFKNFLVSLGFTEKIIKGNSSEDTFTYLIDTQENTIEINYVYTPTKNEIFDTHTNYWNINNINAFIAVTDDKTFIINAKAKPNHRNPTGGSIRIASFDYGVNSEGFEKEKLREISKEYIDATYFVDFVIKHQKKTHSVDKDLLLNLIALRNDLLDGGNDEVVHLLILRCLFIKYLEDRGIYRENYLSELLESANASGLVKAFDEIKKINGDIFKFDPIIEKDIRVNYLNKLSRFFNRDDYRTGQLKLFPYRFDKIPIQLISHVYEAFLRSDEKKGKGIYYTPAFVVNFMLSHVFEKNVKIHQNKKILDPAVGSAAFLVESFKAIINSYKGKVDYEKKKDILQNQLFGIDIDKKALQIAAFSLYLALLEKEDPQFIREQIEKSYPILPSLIGTNLIHANALTDNVFRQEKFDYIVSNPPWSSVELNSDPENIKEREAIGAKGKAGTMQEYVNVSDYERSQAFLIRVQKWSKEDTILALIVKNSIFLNDNSKKFRQDFLDKYQLNYFYELSNYNKILFKKQVIGKIQSGNVEIGATEPCAVLVFELSKQKSNITNYISPKLNDFSQNFELIHYTQKDIHKLPQNQFIKEDILWRILVNGDFDCFKLIKNKFNIGDRVNIECRSGITASTNMKPLGEPDYRELIEPNEFIRYKILGNHKIFNLNQEMERSRNKLIFEGNRILFPIRPLKSDNYRLRCVRVSTNKIHKYNISCVRVKTNDHFVNDNAAYLALFNSKLIGFFIYHLSPQWDKGEEKRGKIRNSDIESLPVPHLQEKEVRLLTSLVGQIERTDNSSEIRKLEEKIDELVFNIYNLKEYEKEIIREFYQVKVERARINGLVKETDIENYIKKFSELFNRILAKDKKLIASYKISINVGAVVCFTIVDEKNFTEPKIDNTLHILRFVKNHQLQQADISKVLNEDKVKIYENEFFYIIKSNQFKDWTIRQAIKDAKEEISLMVSHLPVTHENQG
jgi:hypothetical protein